jgi:isopenicillin-N N-acyltransferase-like protein
MKSSKSVDPSNLQMTRRAFSSGLLVGVGGALAGCAWLTTPRAKKVKNPTEETGTSAGRYEAGGERRMQLLEVRGSPREIGAAIGGRFARMIRGGLEDRAEWFNELKTFAEAQPPNVKQTFLAAAQKHAPAALEELRGWAEGSGVAFDDLLILNLKAEYAAMRDEKLGRSTSGSEGDQPGCSTIALTSKTGKMLLVHNEDGNKAYEERMFMLRIHPEGKPSFLCASYPGILPGNAPWINSAGIVMTTNFIYSKEVKLGVGRYFLDRTAMEAKNLEQALKICQHPERAYAFHHAIGSRWEGRLVSLEVTPTRQSLRELGGGRIFIHTNHLVHPALTTIPQDAKYVGTSSMSRYKVLAAWMQTAVTRLSKLGIDDLVTALKSHEGRPYSPCRHPEGAVEGATLLTAAFDVPEAGCRIYKGQPCNDKYDEYEVPRPVA